MWLWISDVLFDPRTGQFILAVFVLIVTYLLSLRAYFIQKEYEQVRFRYLDNGLDRYASFLEDALSVYRHNWSLLLRSSRQFREMEDQFDINDFSSDFKEFDHSLLNLTFNIRVSYLVDDQVLWTAFQMAISFVGTRSNQIKVDYGDRLKELLEVPNPSQKISFLEGVTKLAEEMADESAKYETLQNRAENLAEFFARKRYRYSELGKFRGEKQIKLWIDELKVLFPDQPEERAASD